MVPALVWVIPILFIGVSVIQWGITRVLHGIIIKTNMYDMLWRIKEKLYLKRSTNIIVTVCTVAILVLGTAQTAQFYLVNGAYFWFAILSFGLYLFLFIVPWLNLILPYRKKFKLISILLFNMSTGTLLLWIIALINSSNVIYLDEGGVSSRPANIPLKVVTIGLLIVYYVLSEILMVLADHVYLVNNEKTITKPVIKPVKLLRSNLHRIKTNKSTIAVKNWIKDRLNSKNMVVLVAMFPAMFILIVLLIEKIAKYDSIPSLNTILLSVTIVTIVDGLISLLFLANHQKWTKRISLAIYTIISLINLLITVMFTKYGFVFLFEIMGEGLNSFELYLLSIKQIGVLLLNTLAWIFPYLLLYRNRKNPTSYL
ncbi:hypothetical protein [Enterococcus sp. AZ072]|uniref:hypothetical protein n=1 Tax=unclassified Enterococcus TaxID=2608891 RepID=UPI003D27E95B